MSVKTKLMNHIITSNDTELDIDFYRESYADLKQLSNKRLKNHWHFTGKKEGKEAALKSVINSIFHPKNLA